MGELRYAFFRRSALGLAVNYQYALSRLPTAYYHIDVTWKPKNEAEVNNSIRDELNLRVNRVAA